MTTMYRFVPDVFAAHEPRRIRRWWVHADDATSPFGVIWRSLNGRKWYAEDMAANILGGEEVPSEFYTRQDSAVALDERRQA